MYLIKYSNGMFRTFTNMSNLIHWLKECNLGYVNVYDKRNKLIFVARKQGNQWVLDT